MIGSLVVIRFRPLFVCGELAVPRGGWMSGSVYSIWSFGWDVLPILHQISRHHSTSIVYWNEHLRFIRICSRSSHSWRATKQKCLTKFLTSDFLPESGIISALCPKSILMSENDISCCIWCRIIS